MSRRDGHTICVSSVQHLGDQDPLGVLPEWVEGILEGRACCQSREGLSVSVNGQPARWGHRQYLNVLSRNFWDQECWVLSRKQSGLTSGTLWLPLGPVCSTVQFCSSVAFMACSIGQVMFLCPCPLINKYTLAKRSYAMVSGCF